MAEQKNTNETAKKQEQLSLLAKAKRLRDIALKRKKNEQETPKPKEQSTLKVAFGVFKEAWKTTGKDFKKNVGFKMGESFFQGLYPYCQNLLFGLLPGVAAQASGAIPKFIGAASLEVIRNRLSHFCRFKAKMSSMVLNDSQNNAVTSSLSGEIFKKPRPYFKVNAPAALSGVVGEIAQAKNKLLNTSVDCLSKAVIFSISSASLFAVDPRLAVGVLGVTAMVAKFGDVMNKTYRKIESKMRSFTNRMKKDNSDSIKNTPLVQDTNRVEREAAAVGNRLSRSTSVTQKVTYAKSKAYLQMQTAITMLMEGAIMAAACVDVAKTGDIGRFALISTASWQMMSAGNMLSEFWTEMQAKKNQLIDATKKLVTPKELEREVGDKTLSNEDTKVSVRGVNFAYPIIKDVTSMSLKEAMDREGEINRTEGILKDLSVEFDKGELTAVVGTSGEGKSTLMSLIRHDYDVESGEIYIGDKEIRTIKDEELNAHIAFVDQNVHFFDDTIMYNLRYFKEDATEEEIMKACEAAGFGKDIEKFKDGLNHRIGQDGSQLSGGQRQRLALARAFLTDKPIVIMDEPTTGLDAELSLHVMRGLKELAKEKTVIMVTHNPTEVALSDRVVVVQGGQVVADGKPMDLVKSNDFLKKALTESDIKNKRKLYNATEQEVDPRVEIAELVKKETSGKKLSDEERLRKRGLLEAHPSLYVEVYKKSQSKRHAKDAALSKKKGRASKA